MKEVIIDGVAYVPKCKKNIPEVQEIVDIFNELGKKTNENATLMVHSFSVSDFGDDFELSRGGCGNYPVMKYKKNHNLTFFPED